jgi:hypothetical protein
MFQSRLADSAFYHAHELGIPEVAPLSGTNFRHGFPCMDWTKGEIGRTGSDFGRYGIETSPDGREPR